MILASIIFDIDVIINNLFQIALYPRFKKLQMHYQILDSIKIFYISISCTNTSGISIFSISNFKTSTFGKAPLVLASLV